MKFAGVLLSVAFMGISRALMNPSKIGVRSVVYRGEVCSTYENTTRVATTSARNALTPVRSGTPTHLIMPGHLGSATQDTKVSQPRAHNNSNNVVSTKAPGRESHQGDVFMGTNSSKRTVEKVEHTKVEHTMPIPRQVGRQFVLHEGDRLGAESAKVRLLPEDPECREFCFLVPWTSDKQAPDVVFTISDEGYVNARANGLELKAIMWDEMFFVFTQNVKAHQRVRAYNVVSTQPIRLYVAEPQFGSYGLEIARDGIGDLKGSPGGLVYTNVIWTLQKPIDLYPGALPDCSCEK